MGAGRRGGDGADIDSIRQRYLSRGGLGGLLPKDALTLLLSYCVPKNRAREVCLTLLERFGTVGAVVRTPPKKLTETSGLNAHAARVIGLLPEIAALRGGGSFAFGNTERAAGYFANKFKNRTDEAATAAFWGRGYFELDWDVAGEETPETLERRVGVITRKAIEVGAEKVAVSHCHPAGVCSPSAADIRFTETLAERLGLFGIDLVDHIIIGRDGAFSMIAEKGRIGL